MSDEAPEAVRGECPDCGSGNAVPKWEAWDALCEVPPKAADTLAAVTAERDAPLVPMFAD